MTPINYNGMDNFYTFMGWQLITDTTSLQYKLREESGENFDQEGFGVINGCYVIACCERYGNIGDYVDWKLANNSTLHTIIGDLKSSSDPNNNTWGHTSGNNLNVIEFVVDETTWYTTPLHPAPGTSSCHPEWAGIIQGYENIGNYWDNPYLNNNNDILIITGKRYVNEHIRNVKYIGSLQADGYIYFNDDIMWRYNIQENNLQRFYFTKEIWVKSADIEDIQIQGMSNTGGTSLPPGGDVVENAVRWAINIAEDDTHGYDQATRDYGIDFDCSSLVSWAFRVGGGLNVPLPSPATYSMIEPFTALGFKWIEGIGNNSSNLSRGDVLLNIQNHVAIYIGSGLLVEACINEFGGITGGQPGDQTGVEIRVGGFYSFPWDGVLRYGG